MPFPYDFDFGFDKEVMGIPTATLVQMGLKGNITPETHTFPTATINRLILVGMTSSAETMAGTMTKKYGLSGEIE